MALIYCKECGKEISDKALKCPHCGCPMNEKQSEIIEKIKITVKEIWGKLKSLSRKQMFIFGVVIFALILLMCIPSKSERDKSILKEHLLNPNSLIIYEAYVNENYGEKGHATLFYFGAENKRGGISDDWALICGNEIIFYSDFESAERKGDNKGILNNAEVVEAKFAVSIGNKRWKKINIK